MAGTKLDTLGDELLAMMAANAQLLCAAASRRRGRWIAAHTL